MLVLVDSKTNGLSILQLLNCGFVSLEFKLHREAEEQYKSFRKLFGEVVPMQ